MTYLQANQSDRQAIKHIAYKLEPNIWESYSGKHVSFKRDIDEQRTTILNQATKEYYND